MAGKLYESFKEAILYDAADFDFNKAYDATKAMAKVKVTLPDASELDAVITAMSHTMSSKGAATTTVEWATLDGKYTGSAEVPYFEVVEGVALTLKADSFFKHYPSQPDYTSPWFEPKLKPKEIAVDLSQIEADLAALPSAHPFLIDPAASGSGWNDHSHSHYSNPLGKVTEVVQNIGGLSFDAIMFDEPLTVENGDEVSIAWTADGLISDVSVPKKKVQSKKLQEANAEVVMKKAIAEAATTLWAGLHSNPWPDKLNTLNGVHSFQLADGTMLEVLLTVKPKEVKP
jgi:hypothetical protein